MKFKKLFAFCLLLVVVFFTTEFIMDFIFEDKTPLWKIIAISFISAFGIFYPYLKEGNEFKFENLLKSQRKVIRLNSSLQKSFFVDFSVWLKTKGYKVDETSVCASGLQFKSKVNWNSLGEKYSIEVENNDLIIQSKAKFVFDFIDYGIALKKIIELERVINSRIEILDRVD